MNREPADELYPAPASLAQRPRGKTFLLQHVDQRVGYPLLIFTNQTVSRCINRLCYCRHGMKEPR